MVDAIERETEKPSTYRSFPTTILAILALLIIGVFSWFDTKASVKDLAQQIIDNNITNNKVSVDFISLPAYHAIPFAYQLMTIGALYPEFSGYFSLRQKEGNNLNEDCQSTTVDYTVRVVGDGMITMTLPSLSPVKECQP